MPAGEYLLLARQELQDLIMLKALRDEMSYGAVSRREQPLASHIPYTRHVEDRVIKTRENHYQTFLHLSGFSFETADMSEINSRMLARNDLVRTLGNSRFGVTNTIIRREVPPQLGGSFDNPFCAEFDARYHEKLAQRRMFVNDFYLTITRRPLQGQVGTFEQTVEKLFGRKTDQGRSVADDTAIRELLDVTESLKEALGAYGPRVLKVERREDGNWHSKPLEFLIQILNGASPRPMLLPRMDLAEALSQKRVFFGRNAFEIQGASKAQSRFGAMLSIREYPAFTGPGFFDNLLSVPQEFIVTQTFGIIDKPETLVSLERISRQINMSDEAGTIVADQIATAKDELLSSEALYGEHHFTVMPLVKDLGDLDAAITAIGAGLTDRAILWVREDLNCEPAFWAQLPGNFAYISRRAVISSKNFAGFASLHNFPSGKPEGNHWGPAITVFETTSQTAYYFNFHQADLGNFTVVGPSGSGKTVFLAAVAAQSQRISPRPKLVFIDKDRGAEIFIRAMGGQYEILEAGTPTGFNPMALENTGYNRDFLFQLFSFMLKPSEGAKLTATEEQVLRDAINVMMRDKPETRSLLGFATLLRGRIRASENDLQTRLNGWIKHEEYGWLFNNRKDTFNVSSVFGFDMTSVLNQPVIRTAALMYLFHRMDELLDGTPVLIFLDEGWRLLDDDVFLYYIKDKLKTIRKLNGVVGFGTQSASDIVNSKAGSTLIEQTATNIFFPNPKADDASYKTAFGLTEREMDWLRSTVPEQRQFIIKHGLHSVIAKLNLAGMPDLIKVLSGRKETVQELDDLRKRLKTDDPAVWLPVFMERTQA
jgi:type IV secretion system protein VirB4